MSTNIRFKRSDIPGKVPSLDSIDLGELALNTADGKLFTKQEIKQPAGAAAIQKIIEIGASEVPNVLYVAKNGDDSNSGRTLGQAFLTLKKALSIATPGTTIFLKSGEYIEDNPLRVPARVSVVGDNLRNTTVRPKNPTKDIFWVYNGAYIFCMNFKGHIAPSAAVCFPPDGSAGEIVTSPYTQAVTSITTTGTGMRVDGAVTTGLRSMVCDAFTQYNQGGIGIHMLNRGNTQLVSIFTICCDISFMCENGGFCSVNLSNSSFGNFGLVSRGASDPLYRGVVKKSAGRQITFKNLAKRPNIGDGVLFANYNQTTCDRDNGLIVDGLAFDLLYEGTTQSTFAGLRYWAKDGITTGIQQQAQTAAAIKRAQIAATRLIQNPADGTLVAFSPNNSASVVTLGLTDDTGARATAKRIVSEEFEIVSRIIIEGPVSPSLIIGPDLDAAEPEYKTLREQILDRKAQIADDTVAFIKKNYPAISFIQSKCKRDVELVIEAVADDIILGTNYKSIKAAITYLTATPDNLTIDATQTTATIEGFKFARDKIVPLVQEDATLLARVQANFEVITTALKTEANGGGVAYITDLLDPTSSDNNKLVFPVQQDTDETVVNLVKNLQYNKEFVKAEVIEYINRTYPEVVAYGYSETTCARDLGYTIDAICYDLIYGGNSQTLDAAKRYYNYASGLSALRSSEEVPATIDAYGRSQLFSQRVVILDTIQVTQNDEPQVKVVDGVDLVATTQTQVNRLGALYSVFLKQLATEIVGTSDFIQPNGKRLNDSNLEAAFDLLQANKQWIRNDVVNYLSRAYPGFDYDKVKCSRDVGYIVDSICFDLVHGGNRQAVTAGIYYFDFNEEINVLKSVLPNQIKQTVNAYKYMKELLRDVLTCSPVPNPWQPAVPQRTDLPAATGSEVVAIGNLIDIINEILVEGPDNSEDSIQRLKQPIGLTASSDVNKQRAFDLLLANRDFIRAEMIAYINQNWYTISDGDTQFARVNTATDLTLGTTTTGYPTVTYQPTVYKAIRDAVLAAKEDIKTETIKFMANSFFDNFSFNKPKCYRDVGLILDAILSDMIFGSNYKTINSAISYLRAYASEVVGAQKVQTVASLKAAKSITLARIVNPAAKEEISTRFDIIIDILDKARTGANGLTETTATVPVLTYPIPVRSNEQDWDHKTAVDILRANIEFIKDEVVAYIDANFTLNEFDKEKCSRDTGLIIDAVGYDLMFLSNFRSITAGRAYLRANAAKVTGNQKLATLGAFTHLKKLLVAVVKSNNLAVNSVQRSMDIILEILDKGESAVPKYIIPFPEKGRSIEFKRARDLVEKNRDFIIDDVLAYVNTPGLERLPGDVFFKKDGAPVNGVQPFFTNGTFVMTNTVAAWTAGTQLVVGDLVRVSGTTFGTSTIGGYASPSTYKVSAVSNSGNELEFTLVNLDGSALETTGGTTGRTSSMRFEVVRSASYTFPAGFDFDKCRRDLGLILDAVYYDTTYGGILESRVAAESYFVGAVSQLGNQADEIAATIRAYEYLRVVVKVVAEDGIWAPAVGNTTTQTRSPNGSDGSANAAREMSLGIDFIINVLRDDSTLEANVATQASFPDLSWVNPKSLDAHKALQAKREETQEAVTNYVDENYVLFGYDREKCRRDVGYVIEAINYDMLFNSNFRSMIAGRSYYRAMASVVVKDQKSATLASFQYLKDKLLDLVKPVDADNPTPAESLATQRVSRGMDLVLKILENGLAAEPMGNKLIITDPTDLNATEIDRLKARTIIEANRDWIEDEIIDWIDNEIANNVAYTGVTYNETACRRDVEYILDAVRYDLTYGGNLETIVAARAYYGGTSGVNFALGSDEQDLTVAAYAQLATLLEAVAEGTATGQPITTNPATNGTVASTLIGIIEDYVENPTQYDDEGDYSSGFNIDAARVTPDTDWADVNLKLFFNKLADATNVTRLKNQVTDFVDLNFAYNKDKCARDVGFLIDALCYDLLYGGNVDTTQAAIAYFDGAVTPKSTIPKQIIQTVAAYERMKEVLAQVVQLKDVSVSSNKFVAKASVEASMDLVIKILRDGPGFTPARPYTMTLPTGGANNASNSGYQNARNLVVANRDFIRAETIAYIDNQPTVPAYNKTTCERDIDLILDAVIYDLTYGGTTATTLAAEAYYTASTTLGTGEVAATSAGFGYMASVLQSVILAQRVDLVSVEQNRVVQIISTPGSSAAATAARELIEDIIVEKINGNAVPAVVLPDTSWVSADLTDITALFTTTWKNAVKDKVNTLLTTKFPDINYTGTTRTNCEEDIDAVVDAVKYDLLLGSNYRSQLAGNAYYRVVANTVLTTQKDGSIATFELVKDAFTDLLNSAIPEQNKSGQAGNLGAGQFAAARIQDIIDFVDDTETDPTETEASTAWVDADLVDLSDDLDTNKTTIKESITTYISDRFPELDYSVTDCEEDIVSIIDAVRFDMMFDSNFRTITAARAYYRAQAALAIGEQKTATLEAFRLLKEKLVDLVNTNATATERVSDRMDLLIRIVDKGLKAIPSYVLPSPTGYNVSYLATYGYARNLLESNREFLKNEVIKKLRTDATFSTLAFNESKCLRDLDLILDALYYDMTYGGNMESIIAGGAYYLGTMAADLTTATLSNVQVTGTAGQFSCTSSATPLAVGDAVVITGALTGSATITGYATGKVYRISATNTTTTFTLTNVDGTAIATTAGTTDGLTVKFSPDQALSIAGDDVAATIAAYEYLKDLVESVAQGLDVSQLQTVIPQVQGDAGSVAGAQTAKNLAYVVRNLINSVGAYRSPTPLNVSPSISWVDLSLKTPNDLIELYKTSDPASTGYLPRFNLGAKLTEWVKSQQRMANPNDTVAARIPETLDSGPLLPAGSASVTITPVGDWTLWFTSATLVTGSSVVAGKRYKIVAATGSSWSTFGSPNDEAGTVFTATANGSGTGTAYECFNYDVDKCERDVFLVMDAVRYDMMFGTNFRTITAARSYWRQQANQALATGSTANSMYPQTEQSILLFTYMKELLQSLPNTLTKAGGTIIPGIVNGSVAHTRIGELMDILLDVLDAADLDAVNTYLAEFKPYNLPIPAGGTNNSKDAGFRRARDLIEANRSFIKAEIFAWMDQQRLENRDGFVTPFDGGFDRTECAEDLDLILDAIFYDLTYGGNMESYVAGLAYYAGSGIDSLVNPEEREATIRVYNQLGVLLADVARSNPVESLQVAIEQVKGTAGSIETAEKLAVLMDIVINVVKGGVKQVPVREEPNFLAGDETLAYVRIAVQEQKKDLQARIADYIDSFILQYNTEKCARDVGLILDAAMYDLVLNSNFQSITAGSVYLQKAAQVVTNTQIGPQLQAIKFIRDQVIAISQTPPLVKNEAAIGRITNLFDTMFDIIDKGVEVAPEIVNIPPLNAAFNPNAVNAANSILANKEFLKEEVVAYVTANYKTYDQSRCSRDVGLIIDAALYDLLLDTNYNSVKAGLAYRRATSSLVVTDQLQETLGGIDFAKQRVVELLDDADAIASVTRSFELISSIIGGGSVPTSRVPLPGASVFALPRPSGSIVRDAAFKAASDALLTAKATLKTAVTTWIASQVSGATAGSIWAGFTYDVAKCEEDVGFILDAVAYDLVYGGNMESLNAGYAYYEGTAEVDSLNDSEVQPTIAAYAYLADQVKSTIEAATGASEQAAAEAQNLVLLVRNLIDSRANSVAQVSLPDQLWVDPLLQEISVTIANDKTRLQDVIIDYVNNISTYTNSVITTPANYDQDKCRRDVGLVLDAVRYDLMFGTSFRTISAGRSYRRSFADVITGAQNAANINSFIELKERVLGKKLSSVAIADTVGNFTCANSTTVDVTPLFVNQPVRVSGVYTTTNNPIVGYTNIATQPKTYYIISTNGTTEFELSDSVGGAPITTVAGFTSGLTFEIRSSLDPLDEVITQGLLDVTTLNANVSDEALVLGQEYKITSIGTQTVAAGNFVIGGLYEIVDPVGTPWSSIGWTGVTPAAGDQFTATGEGSGTGTAKFVTNYVLYGARDNNEGTVFVATGTPTTAVNSDSDFIGGSGQVETISFREAAERLFDLFIAILRDDGDEIEALGFNNDANFNVPAKQGGSGTYYLLTPPPSGNANASVTAILEARNDINTNRADLEDDLIDWIDDQVTNNNGNFVGFTYTPADCRKDIKLILDAIAYDLTFGGNQETIVAGKAYYDGTANSAEVLQTIDAYNQLKVLIEGVTDSGAGRTRALQLVDDLISYIDTKIEDPVLIEADTSWVDSELYVFSDKLKAEAAAVAKSTTDYINSNFPALVGNYNIDKCRRDVRLVIDAVRWDMMFDTTFRTIVAARSYYRSQVVDGNFTSGSAGSQKPATIAAFGVVKVALDEIVKSDAVAQSRVAALMQLVLDILNDDDNIPAITSSTFPYGGTPNATDIGYLNARDRIEENRDFILAEMRDWLSDNTTSTVTATTDTGDLITVGSTTWMTVNQAIEFSGTAFGNIVAGTTYYVKTIVSPTQFTISDTLLTGVAGTVFDVSDATGTMQVTSTFTGYSEDTCIRDVELVLDALRFDMTFGGNLESVTAGKAYYAGAVLGNNNEAHKTLTKAAFEHLSLVVKAVATNATTYAGSITPAQVTSNDPGSALAADQAEALVMTVRSYVDTNSGDALVRPSTSWVDNNLALIASTMLDRKDSLALQVTDYVTAQFPTLTYSVADCQDDVKDIVEAVRYDMMFGSVFRSWTAGKAYYRANASTVLASQKEASLAAMRYLKGLLAAITGSNMTATHRVKSAMNVVIDTLELGPTTRNAYDARIRAAVEAIEAGKDTVLAAMGTYLDNNEATYNNDFDNYDKTTCLRDIGYLIDAIKFDLTYGGNMETVVAGRAYYDGAVLENDNADHIDATQAAFLQVATELKDLSGVTASVGALIDKLVADVNALIDSSTSRDEVYADASWAETPIQEVSVAMRLQANTIKSQVTSYVTANFPALTYDEEKCARDVGLILDAVRWDMLFNSNFRSITAGRAYWRDAENLAADGLASLNQKQASVAAFTYLKNLLQGIASTNAIAAERVTSNMDIVLEILENGLGDQADPAIAYGGVADPERVKAKNILLSNKDFIKAEVIAYINDTYNSFSYDEELCARDVELITTAVAYDMVTGSNYQTVTAARGYLRSYASDVITEAKQKHITILAFKYLKNLLTNYVGGNTAAKNSITANMDTIINTVYDAHQSTVTAVTASNDTFTTNDTSWMAVDTAIVFGGTLIGGVTGGTTYYVKSVESATEFTISATQGGATFDVASDASGSMAVKKVQTFNVIIPTASVTVSADQTTLNTYLTNNTNIETLVTTGINNSGGYGSAANADICKRDIRLLVQALAFDLTYGGNWASITAAKSYRDGTNALNIPSGEATNTNTAFNAVRDKIKTDTALDPATDTRIDTLVAYVTGVIGSATYATPAIEYPELLGADNALEAARNILLSNVANAKAKTIRYVNNRAYFVYDIVKCERDIGLILDAVHTDIVTNSNFLSVQAGRAYLRSSASGALAAAQKWAILTGLTHAKSVLSALVSTNATMVERLRDRLANVIDIINDETDANVSLTFTTDTTASSSITVRKDSHAAIVAAKQTLINDTINDINNNNPPTGGYDETACRRDLAYIIDAIAHDMLYGGDWGVTVAAKAYWEGAVNTLGSPAEVTSTVAALTYLRGQIQALAGVTGNWQTTPSVTADQRVAALIAIISNVVDDADSSAADALVITAPTLTGATQAYIDANTTLVAAKEASTYKILDYMNSRPYLDYTGATVTSCERDVNAIITALSYDIPSGSNFKSIKAGQAYLRSYSKVVTQEQKQATIGALYFIKKKVSEAVTGSVKTDARVLMNTIIDIVDRGIIATPEITITATGTSAATATAASNTLASNADFIKAEIRAYIDKNYPELDYNKIKCERDVQYILDALRYDLVYGGNSETREAGLAYWEGNSLTLGTHPSDIDDVDITGGEDEKVATVASYQYLADLVKIVLNNTSYTPLQTVVSKGTHTANALATTAEGLVDAVVSIINNVPETLAGAIAAVAEILPTAITANATIAGLTSLDTDTSAEILKAFEVDGGNDVQFFVYNETKCARDVGFIVEALAFDALYGGNKETRVSALEYAYKGGLVIPMATKAPTVGGFVHLASFIDDIVDGTAVTATTGNTETQDDDVPSTTTGVSDLAQIVVDVIKGGASAAPALVEPVFADVDGYKPDNLVVRAIVRDSIDSIAAQTITFINETYAGFGYLQDTCKRDVGLTLDAVAYDLIYGGNSRTKFAAEQYFSGGRFQIPADSKSATVACFVYLDALVRKVIINDAIVTFQNYVDQDKSNQAATNSEVTNVVALFDAFTDILTNGYISVVQLDATFTRSVNDNTYATFHQVSTITTTGHTLEWVGTGIDVDSALPYNGGVPKPENQLVSEKGGFINFTSTDEKGDFRIGPDLTIKRDSGSIVGRAFNKSLLGVVTPYILALQG